MKTRKVISAILAGACALSAMSFSATAATAGDKTLTAAGATTFKISGTVVTPTISVSIPSTVSAVINPYGTAVSDKNGSYGADGVTSPVYKIRNFTTDSAVAVRATPSVTISTQKTDTANILEGTFKWNKDLTAAPTGNDKELYAWVEGLITGKEVAYVKAKDDATAFDAFDTATEDAAIEVTDGSGNNWAESKVKKAPFIDVTVYDKNKEPASGANGTLKDTDSIVITVVPKATVQDTTTGKVGTSGDKYGFSAFRINGYSTPMDNADWTSSDKLTLNLVLNIYPTAKADLT